MAIAISIFAVGTISIFIFAIHLADSPAETLDSIYILAVMLSIFVSYLTILFWIWQNCLILSIIVKKPAMRVSFIFIVYSNFQIDRDKYILK